MNDESFEAALPPTWEIQPIRAGMSQVVSRAATGQHPVVPFNGLHRENGAEPATTRALESVDLKRARRRVLDTGKPAERLPPHALEAEQGVLGCCLLEPVMGIPVTLTKVASDDAFYDLRNRTVWDCLRSLHRSDTPVDIISCQQWLKDHNLLEEVGGITYLNALQDAVPSAANLSYYLDIVTEKHTIRKLIHTCTDVVARVYDHQGDIKSLLDGVERDIERISDGPRGHLPEIIQASDFIQVEIIPPPELVKGLIHQGTKAMIGGASKSYKTWIQLDLALSVATGTQWMGFETTKGRVLYLNFELPDWSFQQRLMHVGFHKGIKIHPEGLDVWNLRGYSAPYHQIIPKIMERIKKVGYSMVVLDPIYKLYSEGMSENDAADVGAMMAMIESLNHTAKVAIVFGAHFSKGNQSGKEAIDRVSGSGVFARDPDSLINFTTHEEEDAFAVETKLRSLPPVEPFVVKWDFPLMRPADHLEPPPN